MVADGSGATWEGYRAPEPKGTREYKNRREDQSVSHQAGRQAVNKHCLEPSVSTCEPRVSSRLLPRGHHFPQPIGCCNLSFLPI